MKNWIKNIFRKKETHVTVPHYVLEEYFAATLLHNYVRQNTCRRLESKEDIALCDKLGIPYSTFTANFLPFITQVLRDEKSTKS